MPQWRSPPTTAPSTPGVRVAEGPTAKGISGFIISHTSALAARRVATASAHPREITYYSDVEIVSLLAVDEDRLAAFVAKTLGALAVPDGGHAELRDTLQTYPAVGGDVVEVAKRLYIHRNTVHRRITRAEELLGCSLADNRLAVAAALKAIHILE